MTAYPVLDLTATGKRIKEIRIEKHMTVNDICERLGIPYPRLADILFQLEMDNVITAIPGNRFAYIEM